MAREAHKEWMWETEGLPLLLGMVVSMSVSVGLWLLVSYLSWVVFQ
jgi:hypothetical protein